MALTENGFERKTYDEILQTQIERAIVLFGEDIDTSENSTFGKLLRLYCLDAADNQELAEGVYLSAFPNTASGTGLDRLCPLAGISRNPATYARHEITIAGTAGTIVELGFIVAAGDVTFHTLNRYTVGVGGTVTATVECDEAGEVGNVTLGSIDTIVNPVLNITGITHTGITVIADEVENDYSLRNRFTQSLAGVGSGTIDAIRGAVLRVSGVESVLIEENDGDSVNANGVPAHGIKVYVYCPSTAGQNVANAIFSKKPVGIATGGDTMYNAYDETGTAHTVWLTFTTQVTIYVRCNVTTNDDYTEDSETEIKNNIVAKLSTYTNGQTVTVTSLYSAIYVDGVDDVTSLEISSDGETYVTTSITPTLYQIARTAAANIEVTVNE